MNRRTVLRTATAVGVVSMLNIPRPSRAATLPPALFVVAHPDDEVLATGPAIYKHVHVGQSVHVLVLTDGEASGVLSTLNGGPPAPWWGVQHVPALEGYVPLTAATMAAARVAETRTALACLSAGLPGTLTLHRAQLPDGAVTAADAQAAILAVANQIAPGGPVRIKTHSHIVDNHADHVAAGDAARALRLADPTRFSDLRHYIEPPYWTDPRLSLVTESWDAVTDADGRARVTNACRAFYAWAPAAGSYAIGAHSVHGSHFVPMMAGLKCLVHP